MSSHPDNPRGTGRLKNGNRPGNIANAVRCGALTRAGGSCLGLAMPNGRCRVHGGKSTGPRTAEGMQRMRASKIKHGLKTKEWLELSRLLAELRRCDAGGVEE